MLHESKCHINDEFNSESRSPNTGSGPAQCLTSPRVSSRYLDFVPDCPTCPRDDHRKHFGFCCCGKSRKTHLGRVAQHCVRARVRHRLQLFRLHLRDSKLTCALASHAPLRRHALLGLHLFSLRGEGTEATRAVPHRSSAPRFLSQNKRRAVSPGS